MLSEHETEFLQSQMDMDMDKENREPATKRAKVIEQVQPTVTMNSDENMVRFCISLHVKRNYIIVLPG